MFPSPELVELTQELQSVGRSHAEAENEHKGELNRCYLTKKRPVFAGHCVKV